MHAFKARKDLGKRRCQTASEGTKDDKTYEKQMRQREIQRHRWLTEGTGWRMLQQIGSDGMRAESGARELTEPLQPQWQHWGALAFTGDSSWPVVCRDEMGVYGAADDGAWHLGTGACAVQVECDEGRDWESIVFE